MLARTEPFSSTAADTTGSTWVRAANPIGKPCRKLKTCRGLGLVSPPITSPNGRSPSRKVNELTTPQGRPGQTLDLEIRKAVDCRSVQLVFKVLRSPFFWRTCGVVG